LARRAARRAARTFGLFALFVLFSALPAAGFHADDAPLLASGSAPGPAWAAYSFSTSGSRVVTDIVASGIGYPIQAAIYVYDGDNHLVFGFSYTQVTADQGLYVDLNPVGVHVDVTEPQIDGGVLKLGATMNDPSSGGEPAVGTFKQLLWISGTASRVDHSLRGDSGVQFKGKDTGRGTFLFTSKDFEGAVNVQGGGGGVEGRVSADTHKTIDAFNTLIGFYRPSAGSVEEMSVDAPFGHVQCPCTFPSYVEEGFGPPFGPGRYRFNLTGAGATTSQSGEVVLGGADARLP
jgi:hypothetical protein